MWLPLVLSLSFSLFAISSVSTAADTEEAQRAPMAIGMNLSGIADWNPGFPFKNLMWGARPWMTRNADGSGPHETFFQEKIPLDKQGYPLEVPYFPEGASQPQVVFTIIPNTTEPGEYVLLYDGEGEIVPTMTTKALGSEPGRIVLELKGPDVGGYEAFLIRSSKKGNHIRNIRIVRAEDEQVDLVANPFRDDFLEYAKQWHSIRYLNWMVANNSLEEGWADRKHTDFYTMVGTGGDALGRFGPPASEFRRLFSGGVPLEIIIQLANMTKTDPWFTLPHLATDEYLIEFAKMVKEKLDPSLTAYIEHSNEVWNWQFLQANYMINSKSAAEGLDPKVAWKNGVVPTEFPYDDGNVAEDGGSGHPERMGVLARRVFKIFESVFSGEDRNRIVRVIGTQQAWPDVSRRMVAYVMSNGGADALASAAYFAANKEIYEQWAAAGSSLTGDQVIADMQAVFEKSLIPLATEQAAIAKANNLRFFIYEGGQHIQPEGQKETDYMPALKSAQFLPGIYDLTKKNIDLHRNLGCDLFVAYSSITTQGTRVGSFGHSEFYGQPLSEAPKLRAVVESNPPKTTTP